MHNWPSLHEMKEIDTQECGRKRKHRKEKREGYQSLYVCVNVCLCVRACMCTAVIAWQLQGYLTCVTAAARVCHLYFTARLCRSSLVCVRVCICVEYNPVASKFTLLLTFPTCLPLSLSPNTDLIALACSVMLCSLHMLHLRHIMHTCLGTQQFVLTLSGVWVMPWQSNTVTET